MTLYFIMQSYISGENIKHGYLGGKKREKCYIGNLSTVCIDLRSFIYSSQYQLRFNSSLRSCPLVFTLHTEVVSLFLAL
jgi:hypothetical protein